MIRTYSRGGYMKNYKVNQLRVHVGVQLLGTVTTSVDANKYKCTIDQDDQGFLVRHNGWTVWIPNTNVIYAVMDACEPTRSAKAI